MSATAMTYLVLASCSLADAWRLPPGRVTIATHSAPVPRLRNPPQCSAASLIFRRKRYLRKIADRVFDDTDVQGAGVLDPTEVYAMVLKVYVSLNRWAIVEPPSRQMIDEAFSVADINRDGQLDRREFTRLASALSKNSLQRVLAVFAINWILGPILATLLCARLSRVAWVTEAATWLANCLPLSAQLRASVCTIAFARTCAILLFVQSLGNAVVCTIDVWIDRQSSASLIDEWGQERYFRLRRRTRKRGVPTSGPGAAPAGGGAASPS